MPTLAPCHIDAFIREVAPLAGAGADTLREAITRAVPGSTPWRPATAQALGAGPADLYAILFATRCLVPGEEHSVGLSHRALIEASAPIEGAQPLLDSWFKSPAFGKGKSRVFLLSPDTLAALADLAARQGVQPMDWAVANKAFEGADLPEDTLRVVLGVARTWAARGGHGLAWILDEDLEPARRALEDRSALFAPIAPALAEAGLPPWSKLTWVFAITNIAGGRFFADEDSGNVIDPIAFAAVWYGPRPRGGHPHIAYTTHRGEVSHQNPPSPGLWARVTDQPDPYGKYKPFSEGPCGRKGCGICAAAMKAAETLTARI